jgi:hypothetical protein
MANPLESNVSRASPEALLDASGRMGVSQSCSAWINFMGIAAAVGMGTPIIDSVLSDDEAFAIYAEPDLLVAVVGEATVTCGAANWTEDSEGTGSVVVGGSTVTLKCNGDGGIVVSVSGGTVFASMRFEVFSTGISGPTDKCMCDGAQMGPEIRVCNDVACDGGWSCRGTDAHPTANCAWVRVLGDSRTGGN